MRKSVPTLLGLLLSFMATFASSASAQLLPPGWLKKLDAPGQQRAAQVNGHSRVIITGSDPASPSILSFPIQLLGGQIKRTLPNANGLAVDVPNGALAMLASSSWVSHISIDRVVAGAMERTGATVGATAVRQDLGYDGTGIGVAIIDSGAGAWVDDLTDESGDTRVDEFVDFVNGRKKPYDDYGHGTHVAGIIAGSGFDSDGRRTGIAPGARLIAMKVLDDSGQGRISDVIAAIDYAILMKDAWNIRVINLSIATGVYESYDVDPLTQAARRAVDAGIVVVAAAGNNGRGPNGTIRYGGVTAPGNAPWVLTVGASSHMGTIDRADDTMAAFSSRGPAAIDYGAKPDLVAPGVGIESLSAPGSTFYVTKAPYLLNGTVSTWYMPYLSLSGTSMAAPVVTGTVALMLQANPELTPNEVKAILEYTAQRYHGYDRLTQGSGFLNAKGAVDVAAYLASPVGGTYPSDPTWSRTIIWGNRLIQGGQLTDDANAWSAPWGAPATLLGQPITWGVSFTDTGRNVVWGSRCGGDDCQTAWTVFDDGGAVVSTDDDGDTVVWGTDDGDTVVWGTSDDGDTVVWGTSCDDASCEPTVWNTAQ